MGKKVDKIYDLMSQLDRVGRNGFTGYEINKVHNISKEAILIISTLEKIDENSKLEVLKELNSVLELIKSGENDAMDIIRKATNPLISVLAFYGKEFY
jgi:hypothetical protein